MKNLWVNFIIILVVAGAAILIYRAIAERGDEYWEKEVQRVTRMADSLRAERARYEVQLDSLRRSYKSLEARSDSLQTKLHQTITYVRNLERKKGDEFKTLPVDSLVAKLNAIFSK